MSEQKVNIDGQEYNLSDLSEKARGQLANIQIVDQEIAHLQRQLLISQTAKGAFGAALKAELNPTVEVAPAFEDSSFKF